MDDRPDYLDTWNKSLWRARIDALLNEFKQRDRSSPPVAASKPLPKGARQR